MDSDLPRPPAVPVQSAALWALQNRASALKQLDKLAAERRLIDYVRVMWPVLEPARPLVRGWVLDVICEHLEAVTSGQIRRLLVNVPPGTSKSLLTSVFWPSWEWGPRNNPSMRYIKAAYAEHLTIRDNRKAMTLIRSQPYQEMWGERFQMDESQQAKTKFDNLQTGWMLATSVGGMGTGERGDRFIIDDPHSVGQADSEAKRREALQWFTEVVPTRVNDPDKSAMLCIMQRVHEDDISGHILANDLGWENLCIPMHYDSNHPTRSRTALNFKDPRTIDGELMWPERFSAEYLEKDLLPSLRSWGGEYACTPAESPVLMSDLSMRPIGTIVPGDEIIGFEIPTVKDGCKFSRVALKKARVLEVFQSRRPVVKVTLDSGAVIRCTEDHRWYKKREDDRATLRYSPARVGSPLCRICPAESTELSREDERLAGWLAGFFDGDGSVSSASKRGMPGYRPSALIGFYQGAGRNKPNCDRLEVALKRFGFEFVIYRDTRKDPKKGANFEYRQYRLKIEGLPTYQKFLHVIQPVKWRDRLVAGALGSGFNQGSERVISIEPDGVEDVFSLKTETGNYVVWGLASSNCAGQLEQRPSPRGGGMFQRDKILMIDAKDVPRTGQVVRGWDLAASKDGQAAFTASAKGRRTSDGCIYLEDVTRGRMTPNEVYTHIGACAQQDGPSVTQDLPQDPGQAGKAQKSQIAKVLEGFEFSVTTESGSKEDRARPLAAQVEAGKVYLVRAPWNAAFLAELAMFPAGKYKDQVDAASRMYARLIRRRVKTTPAAGKCIEQD